VLWACDDPAAVPYRYGAGPGLVDAVYVAGEPPTAIGPRLES
jgi:hypothetical protein